VADERVFLYVPNESRYFAVEVVRGQLSKYNKEQLRRYRLSQREYRWLVNVANKMKECRRKAAASSLGVFYLLDESFEAAPYYPIALCDIELAGMLGIDVIYVTRIQRERI